ncbi:MAG TPA: glycosyltransferase family 39 protein [Saprospiraceae bacterium]|nr:glycosyltransferase family 39 protein [Saprospiraceae bacterium]
MAKKPASKKNKPSPGTGKKAPAPVSKPKSRIAFLDGDWPLIIFLGLSMLFCLVARLKLLAIPLERDEGSFAYISHWLMRGRQLYTDMLDSKLPGLYTYYGFFTTLFGYNPTGIHIGLLAANLASCVFFFLFARETYNRQIAVLATALFFWIVISPNVVGFAAHATQLLTPFILGGFYFFWKGLHQNRILVFFLSGLFIGIAFTIKQQSAIFGILIALLWWPSRLWWNKKENHRVPFLEWVMLGIGGVLPAVLVVGYFLMVGRFAPFYDWTVTQPFNLARSFDKPWYTLFMNTIPYVLKQFEGIWMAAAAGLIFIFLSGFKRFSTVFGFLFATLGFLSIIIGAAYYKHYFVLAIPGVVLLAAVTIDWIASKTGKFRSITGVAITSILILIGISGRTDYYFNPDYAKIHFEQYGRNMFPEMEKIGKELSKRVPEGQRIGIMGSEPEILVAANRESCTKYLMVYSILFDPVRSPPMQQEYIKDLQDCAPEYLVWDTGTGSWTNGYDRLQFFEQLMQWVQANYETVGLAESRDDHPGPIVWEEALNSFQSQNDFKIYVLKKKATITPPSPQGG